MYCILEKLYLNGSVFLFLGGEGEEAIIFRRNNPTHTHTHIHTHTHTYTHTHTRTRTLSHTHTSYSLVIIRAPSSCLRLSQGIFHESFPTQSMAEITERINSTCSRNVDNFLLLSL